MIREIGFTAFWDINFFDSFCLSQMPSWRIIEVSVGREQNFLAHSEISAHHRKIDFSCFWAYIWIKLSLRYAWRLSETAIFLLFLFHIPKAFQTDYWSFRRPRKEFWRMQKFLHIIEKSIFSCVFSVYLDKWSLRYASPLSETSIFCNSFSCPKGLRDWLLTSQDAVNWIFWRM